MESEKEFDYKQRAPEDRERFDEKWDKIFGKREPSAVSDQPSDDEGEGDR